MSSLPTLSAFAVQRATLLATELHDLCGHMFAMGAFGIPCKGDKTARRFALSVLRDSGAVDAAREVLECALPRPALRYEPHPDRLREALLLVRATLRAKARCARRAHVPNLNDANRLRVEWMARRAGELADEAAQLLSPRLVSVLAKASEVRMEAAA